MRHYLPIISCCLLLTFYPRSSDASGPTLLAETDLGIMNGLAPPNSSELGGAASLLLGVGGRIPSTMTRAFLIAEGLVGTYSVIHQQNFREITYQRQILNLGLGMRLVRPVLSPHFRLFGDIQAVFIACNTEVSGSYTLEELNSSALGGGLRLAAGFQFRPLQFLSVGARFSMTTPVSDVYGNGSNPLGLGSEAGHHETSLQLTVYY